MNTYVLTCPKCGASLRTAAFAKNATCEYCGAQVNVREDEGDAEYQEWVDRPEFPIDIPANEFYRICVGVSERFKEIISTNVGGTWVVCYVKPIIGREWKFLFEIVDFTKQVYNIDSENKISFLPKQYAKAVLKELTAFRKKYTSDWHETTCPVCRGRMVQQGPDAEWVCEQCQYTLPAKSFSEDSDFVMWYCDKCGRYLNSQSGFNTSSGRWMCQVCGFENDVTDDSIIE